MTFIELSSQQQQNSCVLRTLTIDLEHKQMFGFIRSLSIGPLTKVEKFLDLRLQSNLHHLPTSTGSGLLEHHGFHQSCYLRRVGKGNLLGGKNQNYFI